jgi:TPP-dependent pyruvate/acetoin dehydrogenase alpha subunit
VLLDQTELLRTMMLIRAFEEALAARPDHGFQLLSSGEEAVAAGLCSALGADDQLLTGGRSIGAALARGTDPNRLMAELLGKSTGTNRGKAGRGHVADPDVGFFGAHAVVGGNISIAAGVALSKQLTGEPGLAVILFGDGAAGAGALHETLNIAAIWRLPLLFVCSNNQFSVTTRRSSVLAPKNLSDIASTFQIPSQSIDGMDVRVVAAAAHEAVTAIRSGNGPAFIECVSARFTSHSTTARETRTPAELQEVRSQCPIRRQINLLKRGGELDENGEQDMAREIAQTVSAALAFADSSPYPTSAEALTDV